MKLNPYYLIFIGILFLVMGLGNDSHKFIPNELKILFGILTIGLAFFLIVATLIKGKGTRFKNLPIRKSYIYLILGILIMKGVATNHSLLSFLSIDTNFVMFFILSIGIIVLLYGLKLFFEEKKKLKN